MRGRKPTTIREEAKCCAERMGYNWVENTNPGLEFDGFMFNETCVAAVRLKKIRTALEGDVIIEKKFPREVEELRRLPLPVHVIREFWFRTQNVRPWRRFYILPEMTAEIGFNSLEHYRNPDFSEKWMQAPVRRTFTLKKPRKDLPPREMKTKKPAKGSESQSDEGPKIS